MNKKEHQVTVLQNIFMSILLAIVFTIVAQFIQNRAMNFSWLGFWLPAIFGAFFGYLIIAGLPITQLGIWIASKLKAKPGSFLFGLIVSFIIALIFVPIMVNLMGIFSGVVIPSIVYDFEHIAPVMAIISNSITWTGIPLFFAIAWPLAFIISRPFELISRAILNTPKPQMN